MRSDFHLLRRLGVERDRDILVWLFNIGAERVWNAAGRGLVDRSEDEIVLRMEEMNFLLCRPQDVMILRQPPDEAYLARMREWGFEPPRILVPEPSDPWTPISELVLGDERLLRELALLGSRDEAYLVPYAVTPLEERLAERSGLRLVGGPSAVAARVNDKIFNRELATALGFPTCRGRVCHSPEDIREAYEELVAPPHGFEKVVLKEPHGASGKGLYLLDSAEKLTAMLRVLARTGKAGESRRWLVEGWYRKSADLNSQLYVAPNGASEVFSINRQLLRDTVYVGSVWPPDLADGVLAELRRCGGEIGRYLHGIGYSGVAGIDAIRTADGELMPVIEINGRFTLSTYLSFAPSIIGDGHRCSRYFRIAARERLDHRSVCEALERRGLLYRRDTREGVIVYTSGTLPIRRDERSGLWRGRLFAMIAAPELSRVEEIAASLEEWVESVQAASTVRSS